MEECLALWRLNLLTTGRSEATVKSYTTNVRLFGQWCQQHQIDWLQATRVNVQTYLVELLDRLSHNTVPLRLSSIRAFYAFAINEGWRSDDPTRSLHVKRFQLEPRVPWSDGDLRALLAACTNDRDRAMIMLAYAAGLRVSELMRLRASDIRLSEGTIRIRGKGGKERTVAPGVDALRLIAPYMRYREGILWWTVLGSPRPATLARVKVNFDRIRHRAGLDEGCWHRLRVSFANRALTAGVPLEDLQVLMGHAHIETTRHYAGHAINGRALANMRRLNLAGGFFEGNSITSGRRLIS